MRVARTASTTETASARPAPARSGPTWSPRPCRRRIPEVMTRASNMRWPSALAPRGGHPGGEGGLPRLAHARRAEAERSLVQAVELALAVSAHVHDVEVAQDAELVRGGRGRGPQRPRQVAHAQFPERERVDELAAGGVAERAE